MQFCGFIGFFGFSILNWNFLKSKTNNTKTVVSLLLPQFFFFREVQRILESCFFLSAQNSCRARRFLLDNKIFFLTFNTITFLLPKDALHFYKEKKYKCLYSKSTSSKLNSLKSHEKRYRGLNISENRK